MALDQKYLDMLRPKIRWGKMKIDREECIGCGQCVTNCPGKLPALDDEEKAYLSRDDLCITCSNCMVACPTDAISIEVPFLVEEGFYKSLPTGFSIRPPAEPGSADGSPDEYNDAEKLLLERRSCRNYKSDPVPEPYIRRILEAGRAAPSAGNCQPWRFIVVTDKALLEELAGRISQVANMITTMYWNDEMLGALVEQYEADPKAYMFDPRLQSGTYAVGHGILPVFLNAPLLIILLGDERSIAGPDLNIGICGTNMTVAANSLGLGACWVGFTTMVNMMPDLLERLGIEKPFTIVNSIVFGYESFNQRGMVAREAKPVAWFREGVEGPEFES